jgi:hypothetical protein
MITYKKDSNITYTQMAMWVDANAYAEDCDVEKMYIYIYHLAFMLAKKRGLFQQTEDFDKFALFTATRMLKRYRSSRQFTYNEDGTPKSPKIKSVLNYLKKSLHLCKIDFQESELFVANSDRVIYVPSRDLGEYMVDNTNIFDTINFCYSLDGVASVVKSYLENIPYKKGSSEWYNIYMSCLLTLINSMTLPSSEKDKLTSLRNADAQSIERAYTKIRYDAPILFHLPPNMTNYIRVLVNEIRHCLAEALSYHNDSYISADDTLKGIIIASLDLEEENEY